MFMITLIGIPLCTAIVAKVLLAVCDESCSHLQHLRMAEPRRCGHQAADRKLECFQSDEGAAHQFAAACVKIAGSIAGSNSLLTQ